METRKYRNKHLVEEKIDGFIISDGVKCSCLLNDFVVIVAIGGNSFSNQKKEQKPSVFCVRVVSDLAKTKCSLESYIDRSFICVICFLTTAAVVVVFGNQK